jgi:hypothetical protein
MSKATPRPWKIAAEPCKVWTKEKDETQTYTENSIVEDENGNEVLFNSEFLCIKKSDLELIVRAVNCYDELIEELSIIHSDMSPEGPDCEAWHRIKQLLKRARGEK